MRLNIIFFLSLVALLRQAFSKNHKRNNGHKKRLETPVKDIMKNNSTRGRSLNNVANDILPIESVNVSKNSQQKQNSLNRSAKNEEDDFVCRARFKFTDGTLISIDGTSETDVGTTGSVESCLYSDIEKEISGDCGSGTNPEIERPPIDVDNNKKNPREILEKYKQNKQGIFVGYYGSWNSQGYGGKFMADSNPLVSVIYIAFGRINMNYDVNKPFLGTNMFSTIEHGLEYETFAMMTNDIARLRKARPDVIIMLSVGGDTYMIDINMEVDYIHKLTKMINDFELDGIDIDWEPYGGFDLLNELDHSNYYINLIDSLKESLPEEKLISLSGSSNAALSCIGLRRPHCQDCSATYNNNYLTEKQKSKPELYRAADMVSAGSFINIFNTVKDKIDLVFIQSYNLDSKDTSIMVDLYLSHLYYGIKYNYVIILGFSLEQGRGGFSPKDTKLLELVGKRIHDENQKHGRADGIGIWHLFMQKSIPTGTADVDTFIGTMWDHLNSHITKPTDNHTTQDPNDCNSVDEYVRGIVIPDMGVVYKYNDVIWKTKAYSTHAPGVMRYEWEIVKTCYPRICNDKAAHYYNTDYVNGSIVIWKGEPFKINYWQAGPPEGSALDAYTKIDPSECPGLDKWNEEYPHRPIETS